MTLKSKLKTIFFFFIFNSFFIASKIHATPLFLLQSSKHLPQNLKEKSFFRANLAETTVKLKDVFMTQKSLSSDRADMEAQIVVIQTLPSKLYFKLHYGMELIALDTFLESGEHRFSLPFVIQKPILSGTNSFDTPLLYTFRTFVTNGKGQSDEMQSRIGLRPMESIKKQIYNEGVLVDKNLISSTKTVNMTSIQASDDAKKPKEDVFLSLKIEYDTFKLSVKNNRLERAMGDFIVDVFDRKGRLLFNDARLLRIEPNNQLTFYRYDLATMLQGERAADVVIITTWKDVDNLPNETKKIFYVEPTTFTITNGE